MIGLYVFGENPWHMEGPAELIKAVIDDLAVGTPYQTFWAGTTSRVLI